MCVAPTASNTTIYLQVVIDRLLASESLYQDAGKMDHNEDAIAESKRVKDTTETSNEPEHLESRRPVR